MGDNIKAIAIIVGLFLLAYFFTRESEPEYIHREFNNGSSYTLQVDDSLTSDNWDCTGDCSGHWAGYEWAEEHGIDDPSDCGGNSSSFAEGCQAWANEN